jgi:hypothetical protein
MPIQNDGFTKDPSGSGGGGEAPAGTGFVRVTDGAYDTPASLSATEILAALASGKWPIFTLASVGGTANAITATFGETLASGQFFWLVPTSTSSSTTVNLNVDSVGNKRIKQQDGSTDPAVGDVVTGKFTLLYYDGTVFRQILGAPVSATDSTKLPLSGGTGSPMTGPIVMINTTAPAGSENYICAVSGFAVINGASGRLRAVGANILSWEPGGITAHLGGVFNAPLQFATTQTSPGASIVSDYRDSSGNKIANVATGAYHGFHVNNTLSTYVTATAAVCPALRFSAGSGTFAMLSQVSNTQTAICGDSSAGTTKPEVCVSGNSHTSYPGCVEIKAGAIAQASNGTWTSKYSLAKGTHNGRFIVYDTANAGIAAVYNVIGTTLTLATGGAAEYVISGSESTTTIAGRISSANFQINVGTSISTRSFAVIFEGTVS